MLRNSSLALVAVSAALPVLLAGCDWFKPLPAQFQSLVTLEAAAGDLSDENSSRALAANIVAYLDIEGVDSTNTRIAFDEVKKTYHFELFGKQRLSKTLLDQVAKGLDPSKIAQSWPATVEVAKLEHLDTLLGSKERSFPVRASWKHAGIDAYVVQSAFPGLSMPTAADPTGRGSMPKTALCMLSFQPEPALPKLEGTYEEVHGPEHDSARARLVRQLQSNQAIGVPHEVTFDDPELAKAFTEPPMAKAGKLMFQFAVIEDASVTEFIGDTAPIDFGGTTQRKCLTALDEKYPELAKSIKRMALLEHVKTFGPAHLPPVPVK